MATDKEQNLRRVPVEERRAYLARLASDPKWRRPTPKSANAVWALLENQLPAKVEDLISKSKLSGAEHDQAVLIAKQSLVVALDCAITAGDRGAMLTQNLLFDSLAKYWSIRYRRARLKGARTVYDMREETARKAWRELVIVGIRISMLWHIVTGEWSRAGINPLFTVTRTSGQGHARGWRVNVITDSQALHDFEDVLLADPLYRRRGVKQVIFAENWKPAKRQVRQRVCAERPYNVVNLGPASERVLTMLEQARLKFNVEVFRGDYETIKRGNLELHPYWQPDPLDLDLLIEMCRGRKRQAFLSRFRRIYEQTNGIPLETKEEWEQWGERPADAGMRPEPMSGYRWIRSRFFRAPNRRFHAANFWLENVPKVFRGRWFGVETPARQVEVGSFDPDDPLETIDLGPSWRLVNRDVSSSQTQILALLLGERELEAIATSTNPKFKEWLAQQLWALHEKTPGGLLADGYKGADDPRLVEFIKAHWMRRMYGGKWNRIIRDLGKDTDAYGPGWRTSRGLWARSVITQAGKKKIVVAPSGIGEAEERAISFLTSLPPWVEAVEHFLTMCTYLAKDYDRKDGYATRGVIFHDPLDGVGAKGATVRWHHAQRGKRRIEFGHYKIEVHPDGKNDARLGFIPLPSGTVNRKKLGQFIPPCLIHLLDAFFSGRVILGLRAEGVTDVIATHDCWFVPETFRAEPGGPVLNGRDVISHVVEEASTDWFENLKDVYDRLVHYMGDDPTFGEFVREIQARWEHRVQVRDWPHFTTS